ncbi:MAG: low-specificity L-threonine aldolase [Treponema sp.]|jgi:threonine aldolase|nr:low-specificity L-threonine aldolase [Treponema sp.]
MIDIRSDTVTQPTAAMRKAMAEAEVGDDVYGDDPTINRLEKIGAELAGKEAALFVPSGTFGNQLSLFTWCTRGTEVILGEDSHILIHEAGAASVIAGVQTRPIPAPDGVLTPEALRLRLRKQDLHAPATSLICLENANALGRVVPLADMDAVRKIADEWKLPIHLDGARIFNAAVSLGCKASDIASRVDSVMFCLSKGLCAPVGSLLAGPKDFIEAARLKRKIMGGGMRQAGILAAAGIIALTEQVSCLADDHRRAKGLAKALAKIPGVEVNPDEVDINMVFFKFPPAADKNTAEKIMEIFTGKKILVNAPENGGFRFVTHYWIGDKEIDAIFEASAEAFTAANVTANATALAKNSNRGAV